MDTHTIDVTKTEETCEKMWTPSVDIPTTAAATTIHTALVAALDKANLVETLKGEGPFTVFAPTDEQLLQLKELILMIMTQMRKYQLSQTFY